MRASGTGGANLCKGALTLEENEVNALCVLVSRASYARRYGDKHTRLDSDPYPEKVDTAGLNCPENPKLTIWDVLKVFQANPAKGYATEWQVGNNDYGVRRFFERTADVLDKLDEPTKDLMLSLIDPNSREEPQSRCEERTWQVAGQLAPSPVNRPMRPCTAQRNGLPVDRITEVRVLDPYFCL